MTLFSRIGSFFGNGPANVKQASLLLALTALLSSVLGLFRNLIFYRLIDPGQLDVYYASFRVPDFLFNLLIFGAISSAFVPILSGLLAKEKSQEARRFSDQTFTWLTIGFASLALVLTVFMEPLMRLVVQGFDAERFATTVHFSRILMLQSVFFAWSFTCGGYLNSFRRFASPALAPLVYNISIIAGTFVAASRGIEYIVYAVVIGSLLHFGIQFWDMARIGYVPRWDTRVSQELKELAVLMFPRSISQGMSQAVLLVFTSLASGLTAGSIAILSGMNDLQTTPTVIVVNSLAVALFPTMATRIATTDWDELHRLLQKSFRAILYVLIPSIVLCYVLRAQIVRLYFSTGSASWELTNLAIDTFTGFLIGIIPSAFVIILSRVFYALKDTKTPMVLSVIAGLVGIGWAAVGIHIFHGTVATLAVATSVSVTVQCLLYFIVLKQHEEVRLGLISLLPRVMHYTASAVLAGAAAWATLHVVDWLYSSTGLLGTRYIIGLFLQLLAAGSVGLCTVLIYSKLALPEELAWIKQRRSTKDR